MIQYQDQKHNENQKNWKLSPSLNRKVGVQGNFEHAAFWHICRMAPTSGSVFYFLHAPLNAQHFSFYFYFFFFFCSQFNKFLELAYSNVVGTDWFSSGFIAWSEDIAMRLYHYLKAERLRTAGTFEECFQGGCPIEHWADLGQFGYFERLRACCLSLKSMCREGKNKKK